MSTYDRCSLGAVVETIEMQAINEDYLTVAEAAALLRVASSTIRRWIRQGDIPAYRIGKRRVALRRTDVDNMVAPVQSESKPAHYTIYTDLSQVPKLTPEDVQRSLEAMERVRQINKVILARRGGKPFESSVDIIREMREERMRELG
jgi:excisionase family DNA binding protein